MSSFQIKIVGDFCNIRCSYCRNRDFNQDDKAVMSINTLEKLFILLCSLPQAQVRTNWHGGEPLLAGKDFFSHVLRLQNQFQQKVWLNAIQTNAILVDDEWADFFHNNHFSVGVSVDGSERTHNINRINVAGRGTYKKVMCGVETLRRHNVFPGVICTVTKKTVKCAKEMFMSLVNSGFKDISFNVFYNTASNCEEDIYGLTNQEWLLFLIEIFEAWLALDDPTVRVRELDGALAWTETKSANYCSFKGLCHRWFAVNYTGDIYPCERLGKTILFGNVESLETFQNLEDNPVLLSWKESIGRLPEKCIACDLQSLCYNGCVAHRKLEGGKFSLYTYCESRRAFFDYITQRLGGKEV
ncbi:MAG: SPASM domain-containing protein [Candidatus Zambryskibacteria bacterium]|nr:SPASM domain-containing protein [Candidatus Zambryskibacteria bacterium]